MGILKGVKEQIDVKVTANLDSDNGRTIQVPFVITAKVPKFDERKETLTRANEDAITDEELCNRYLIGWHSLQGADGEEVKFCDEALAEVMQEVPYRKAVVEGIMTAILGKEALRKN